MRINSVKTSQNFGAVPIYSIKLKKLQYTGNYIPLSAKFSQISYKNQDDFDVIQNAAEKWQVYGDRDCFIGNIADDFKAPRSNEAYYITEMVMPKMDLFHRLVSVMEVTNPKWPDKKDFSIYYLQSAPMIAYAKGKSPVKGAGELAIYGAVKLAKENGFENVKLFSSNNAFYDRIGFPRVRGREVSIFATPYKLKEKDYDRFLSRIEEKYSLNA